MKITRKQLRGLIREAIEGHPSPVARPGDDPELLDALAVRDGPSPFSPDIVKALDKVDEDLSDDMMSDYDNLEMDEDGYVSLHTSEEAFEDKFQVKLSELNPAVGQAIEELYDNADEDWENHMQERISAYWVILRFNVESDDDLRSNMQSDYADSAAEARDPYGYRGLSRRDFY